MHTDILISDIAQFQDDIDDYIKAHIDPEGDYLHRLYRATNLHLLYSRMASGHLQGRILKMLVEMAKPKLILEIGTYSGYSALCLAEGLPKEGHLHTIEINDEQEDFTLPWLKGSPYADKITLHIGDALEVIPQLELTFDMAFIDADKRLYQDYYELVLKHLASGGYMLVDNTLWDGHVLEKDSTDLQTRSIQAFNDRVAQDTRVEKVILPLRDGLTIIRKK
ncbi:MAG: class I SAM-dependent methyltransferase [Bacteroidaceae bacterium]|nr:class I SAM-dependent methyltransferase [Bacteroidaceae bacterium]